jgi:hypothetical protein
LGWGRPSPASLVAFALGGSLGLAAGLALGPRRAGPLEPGGASPGGALEARSSAANPPAGGAGDPTSAASTAGTTSAPARSSARAATLGERAAAGELVALKELDRKPLGERTVAEALALEAGHAELARREGQSLLRALDADPALWSDASTLAHLVRLAQDPEVAPSLLEGLARSSSAVAADVLYDLVERADRGGRLTLLADDLLLGPSVRPRASRALGVALSLRHASSCGAISGHLGEVLTHGDERAARLLERVDQRAGCGPKGRDDCWACLRGEPNEGRLERAREAAKARAAPRPWRRATR